MLVQTVYFYNIAKYRYFLHVFNLQKKKDRQWERNLFIHGNYEKSDYMQI